MQIYSLNHIYVAMLAKAFRNTDKCSKFDMTKMLFIRQILGEKSLGSYIIKQKFSTYPEMTCITIKQYWLSFTHFEGLKLKIPVKLLRTRTTDRDHVNGQNQMKELASSIHLLVRVCVHYPVFLIHSW